MNIIMLIFKYQSGSYALEIWTCIQDVPVILVPLIIDKISDEMLIFLLHLLILILNFILISLLLSIKENRVALYIYFITSCLTHIFPLHHAYVFSINSHPFSVFHMPCHIYVGGQ